MSSSTYNGTILARIVKGVINNMLDDRYDTVKVNVEFNLQWYNFAQIVKGVIKQMMDNRYETIKINVEVNLQWYKFGPKC